MAPLVTSQQFQAPSILQGIQQGLSSRGEIQRQGMLTREEENRQRLQALSEQQGASQLATRQRALGVSAEVPEDETQEQALDRAFAADPAAGKKILDKIGVQSQEQKEDLAAFADNFFQAETEEAKQFLIDERVRKIQARGGDATETILLKGAGQPGKMTFEQRDIALKGAKAAALTALQREQGAARGRGAGGTDRPSAPVTLVNPETGEKILVTPVFSEQTGKARLEQAQIPDGFEISRETQDEKRAADIATVGAKKGAEVTGKAIATRRQKTVDSGFESSEQLPSLNRALSLLDEVETGGLAAVAIRAKQTFGIEGANEAELSNRLSEAVLKQLKPTFGAAFTVEEGKRLERISAGLGKSVPGNKRIIKQLIREIEKKAKEGIKAAVASEDFEAAKRIKDNLTFSLETGASDLNAQEQAELEELRKRFQ